MEKVLFAGLGCVVALVVIVIAGFFGLRYVILQMGSFEMPPELEDAHVALGEDVLFKEVLLTEPSLDTVSDIGVLPPQNGEPSRLIVAGSSGVAHYTLEGAHKSLVTLDGYAKDLALVDVEDDGVFEYLDRSGGWQEVSLWNSEGKERWTYAGNPGVNSIAPAGRDVAGVLRFAVGFNGGGGIRMLDADAKELWRQSGANVWHVESVESTADGAVQIVHSSADGGITVRDAAGTIIRKFSLNGVYVSDFAICEWPCTGGSSHILAADDAGSLHIVSLAGANAQQLAAPDSGIFGYPKAQCVRFTESETYFAVLIIHDTWERSVLYLYDPGATLVYQEIFEHTGGALAVVPHRDAEALLVGVEGGVWRYTLR